MYNDRYAGKGLVKCDVRNTKVESQAPNPKKQGVGFDWDMLRARARLLLATPTGVLNAALPFHLLKDAT